MFEERDQAYRDSLTKRIEDHVPSGERVEAVAVTQVGVPPWLQGSPLAIGFVLIVVSLVFGTPSWVGIAGGLLVVGGIVALTAAPRRLLARTNRGVLVFDFPRSQIAAIDEPIARVSFDELPESTGRSASIAGERMWPNYGSGLEHEALKRVLDG